MASLLVSLVFPPSSVQAEDDIVNSPGSLQINSINPISITAGDSLTVSGNAHGGDGVQYSACEYVPSEAKHKFWTYPLTSPKYSIDGGTKTGFSWTQTQAGQSHVQCLPANDGHTDSTIYLYTYNFTIPGSATAGLSNGSHTVRVSATDPNFGVQSANITFTVTGGSGGGPEEPRFTLDCTPIERNIEQGASTWYTVTVQGYDGYIGTVGDFEAAGVPPGATDDFSVDSVDIDTTNNITATLTYSIDTAVTTPEGQYLLVLGAYDGLASSQCNVYLNVGEAGGGEPPVGDPVPSGNIKCANAVGLETDGPCTVEPGGSTDISWSTLNTDTCDSVGVKTSSFGSYVWTGNSGNESTGVLTGDKTYILSCEQGGFGTLLDSVQVKVMSGNIQLSEDNISFTDSLTVTPGTLIYIQWSSVGATSCTVAPGGWSGTSGNQTRVANVQKTYTLTCNGAGGASLTDQATVYMAGPDISLTCTSISKSVAAGQSTVFDISLAYSGGFNSPVSVEITSGLPSGATSSPVTVTPPATIGSVPVSTTTTTPQGTSVLTFTATGGGKTDTCTSQLIVTPPDGAPVLDSLVLTPETSIIDISETVTYNAVAWYTDGTDVNVTLNPATQFASSDKSIASMSGHIATGEGDGTATITAQYTEGAITVADTASLQVGAASGVSASLFCPAGSTQKVCTINSGSSIQLGWQSSGADDCSTDPALVPPASGTSGAASTGNLSGPQTIQYTLTCTGGGKGISATDTATVIVSGPGSSLVESDKDITYINGKSLVDLGLPAPSACSAGTDSVGNVTFKEGDIITFRICIKNSGDATATSITLADQMTNLAEPATGFNVLYQGAPIAYVYDPDTGTIDFTIPGSIAAGNSTTLTFDAKVTKPTGSSSFTLYRFQNRAVIDTAESTDHTVTTPLYLFYAGTRVPSKEEVAP